MAKYPRFLMCTNPAAEPGAEYILHTQKPRFLAKRVYDHPTTDFEILDQIDDIGKFYNMNPSKIAGLMRRLADWYVAFKKNTDNEDADE